MLEYKELKHILHSIEYSIHNLENSLDKYSKCLPESEKLEIIAQIQNYNDIQIKIETLVDEMKAKAT
ncbi:MAG: hypothetical protein N4A48_10275 [Tepidibacter sp.]|jgi:exonuclease VII small subunit|uniref:hypothetical protein n=1 Tax=Tepidibacter sp. TaxID=2529387 RepID=UPI0025F731CF|nr:hypothetical protein [Tepidibacter sp.]MCT4509126.1 hypothetical protein [Tepidibacter sp.]